MQTTTQEILDLVARKIGDPVYHPATSRAIARALGISHSHIAKLQRAEAPMSLELFGKVAQFLNLPGADFSEFALRLAADVATDDTVRAFLHARAAAFDADMRAFGRSGAGRISETVRKGGKVAALAGAAILAVLTGGASPVSAGTYETRAEARHDGSLYIMRSSRRRGIPRRDPRKPARRRRLVTNRFDVNAPTETPLQLPAPQCNVYA